MLSQWLILTKRWCRRTTMARGLEARAPVVIVSPQPGLPDDTTLLRPSLAVSRRWPADHEDHMRRERAVRLFIGLRVGRLPRR